MSKADPTGQPPPPSYEDAAAQHGALPARPPPGKLRAPLPLDIPVLNQLRGKRIILASASPRRKQLLAQVDDKPPWICTQTLLIRQIGLTNLEILPSTAPENLPKTLEPFEYVLQTANRKCLSVYESALASGLASVPDPALVIAADTIVLSQSGRILEKPRSEADHIAMLRMLRDQKSHKVYTAVCVLAPREDARHPGYNIETMVEETKVVFSEEVGDEMITAYVKTRGVCWWRGLKGAGIMWWGCRLGSRWD
jgi:predicted house-cleaning NTP pyrophosphatase (Maf/HAM1 superfamily)